MTVPNELPLGPFTDPPDDYSGLAGFGLFTSLSGMLMNALGSHYQAKGQRSVLEQQASSADFAESMANINARSAESEANAIEQAGQREKLGLALRAGSERAATEVEQGASGTLSGKGSNAEVLASQRFLAQLDAMTMDSNTLRATNAARAGAVNARNEGRLARASAANLRGTAASIDPYAAAVPGLLTGAGTLASQWVYANRYRDRRPYRRDY